MSKDISPKIDIKGQIMNMTPNILLCSVATISRLASLHVIKEQVNIVISR